MRAALFSACLAFACLVPLVLQLFSLPLPPPHNCTVRIQPHLSWPVAIHLLGLVAGMPQCNIVKNARASLYAPTHFKDYLQTSSLGPCSSKFPLRLSSALMLAQVEVQYCSGLVCVGVDWGEGRGPGVEPSILYVGLGVRSCRLLSVLVGPAYATGQVVGSTI